MKIVLLAAGSSIHTIRWANGLSSAGHTVHVISQHPVLEPLDPAVTVHRLAFRGALGYFTHVPVVRKLLKEIAPDIVNAHYASGYGTTARLANYHPWVLSVWGSDVYVFPGKSFFHKRLVRRNLSAADQVLSTSKCMGEAVRRLAPELHSILITPFGVDLDAYQNVTPLEAEQGSELVIGTVKTMTHQYGIDTLIMAFAKLLSRLNSSDGDWPELDLRLVGGGEQTAELEVLARRLGIAGRVNFIGQVPHAEVPGELARLDIYVALSRSESFGVAVLEAGAAYRPVVVSDVGGLPEVTIDGETGFVVPSDNVEAAADALETLVRDPVLRHRMGCAGRKFVEKNYSWDACIQIMLRAYSATIGKFETSK